MIHHESSGLVHSHKRNVCNSCRCNTLGVPTCLLGQLTSVVTQSIDNCVVQGNVEQSFGSNDLGFNEPMTFNVHKTDLAKSIQFICSEQHCNNKP